MPREVRYRPEEDIDTVARVVAKAAINAALERKRQLTDAEIELFIREGRRQVDDYLSMLRARHLETSH